MIASARRMERVKVIEPNGERREQTYNARVASYEVGAGEGNRTLVLSLEGSCSTIELHPHNQITITHKL